MGRIDGFAVTDPVERKIWRDGEQPQRGPGGLVVLGTSVAAVTLDVSWSRQT